MKLQKENIWVQEEFPWYNNTCIVILTKFI